MTVPFLTSIQRKALERQDFFCASCDAIIWALGRSGKLWHDYGEGVEAHHVIPHSAGGPNSVANCVIVCRSCHISAHQGGAWKDIEIYNQLKGSMSERIAEVAEQYPHYNGNPEWIRKNVKG